MNRTLLWFSEIIESVLGLLERWVIHINKRSSYSVKSNITMITTLKVNF